MKSWKSRSVAAVCILLLSGCSIAEHISAATSSGDAPQSLTEGQLRDQVDWADPGAAAPPLEARAKAESDFVPKPKIKPEILDPKQLVGLDKPAIVRILGEPHRITLAQPATVWAWEQDGCRMRLFFYPDLAKKTFRALTYEISTGAKTRYQITRDSMLIETCASRIKWANASAIR